MNDCDLGNDAANDFLNVLRGNKSLAKLVYSGNSSISPDLRAGISKLLGDKKEVARRNSMP